MNNNKYLQSIANGIYAADKINNLLKAQNTRSDNMAGAAARNISIFGEIIKIIADYLPTDNNYRENNLKDIISRSSTYGNTYSQLKQHLLAAKGERLSNNQLAETLSIVKPLLQDKPRSTVDKVLKIYEIIKA